MGQLNRDWKAALRQKYWLQAKGRLAPAHYGRALTEDTSAHLTHNNGAAWSPDGGRIAYAADPTLATFQVITTAP